MLRQDAPIRAVHGIGDAVGEKLERIGILTVGDLLRWYPREYIDASNPVSVSHVPYGRLAAVRVTVVSAKERPAGKNRRLKIFDVVAEDATGTITLRWFNQGFLKQKVVPGSEWLCIGVTNAFKGEKVMNAPLLEQSPRILPIYAQTKGVSSKMLRGYLEWCVSHVDVEAGGLPDDVVVSQGLSPSGSVIKAVHVPPSMEAVESAKDQLAFEEAFWFFVRMASVRSLQDHGTGIPIKVEVEWLKRVVASLPFELTHGQKRAVWDSLKDMENGRPMTRLLNGDVGSGKTAVAALIAAAVAKYGYQSAILAPTEILASQHALGIRRMLEPFGIPVSLYTAATKDALVPGGIVVGTHALFQHGVDIPDLAFVAVDEQHRFGVKQRQALREGRQRVPHLLSMTATPIPRTLALSLFGDLSLSMLPEKPKDRLPIITKLVRSNGRAAMYAKIQEELSAGRQVFVICPLIEEKNGNDDGEEAITVLSPEDEAASEKKTVVAEVARLRSEFPSFGTIEAVHGKMKSAEKQAVMARMAAGEINVLVATSVVEVGVDVPNATVMVIEGAERFGLAQLHQFRGRVGRGSFQSYCFLCPETGGEAVMRRLEAVVATESGFELAQADLDLRGPGQMVGTVQSGLPDFKMASLTDLDLLQRAKAAVDDYAVKHPGFLRDYSREAFNREHTGLE